MYAFKVITTILILALSGYFAKGNESQFTPPRIFPQTREYIIEANSTFTLRCEGTENVTWTPPDNMYGYDEEHKEPKYSKITIKPSTTPDSQYVFGSYLVIENASYLDTGYYYCHGDTTDFNDLSRVSKIYLYVSDPDHFSVILEIPYAVTAMQYSEAILPCRPTSPDIHVDLIQTTGEDIENVSYDPKIGFTLLTNDLAGHNVYSCEFSKGDKKFSLDVLLYIETITSYIAKPHIEELTGGHTIVGEKLVLRCILRVDILVRFSMQWITPQANKDTDTRITISKSTKDSPGTFFQDLTVENTTLEDQGEYSCIVNDINNRNNNTKYVRIYDKSEHFINLTEDYGIYEISVKAGKESVQWRIDVKAHPVPTLTWFNNKGKEIQAGWSDAKSSKYEVHTQSTEAFLKINDITLNDRGYYKLLASNGLGNESLILFLNVTDKPNLRIQMDQYHLINKPSMVKCIVAAFPVPQVSWFYKECQDNTCDYIPQTAYDTRLDGLILTSFLNITTSKSGYVKCYASNVLGEDESTKSYLITDVENGFGIWGYDDWAKNGNKVTVANGDTITLYCGASRYNYTDDIMWIKNKEQLGNDERYVIEKSNTEYSNKLSLLINDIDFPDSGNYLCQAREKSGNLALTNITLEVQAPESPTIISTNLNNSDLSMKLPRKLELYCFSEGNPKPVISWYKNGEEWLEYATASRLKSLERNQVIVFTYTQIEDEGSYQCRATNRVGVVQKYLNLKFDNKPPTFSYYYIIIVALAIFSLILAVVIYIRYRKERILRQELKRAGLANFENGALESFNPELGIDDQAELLPYDRRFEFSREKLKLGKQLGSGAFGVVMKAEAYGITPGEETTIVAVKMVKRSADYTAIKALASELKIMVHLGQHLNVVNLLGACTKNVSKRELLVIVEYCRFGNIHNYLLRNRDHFINQIDSKTGRVDYTFGSDMLERSLSVSSATSADVAAVPRDMVDYRGANYTGGTTYTESTAVSMTPTGGDDTMITSNNSLQPEWRSNYRGDYKSIRPICTKDLITWAFQVSRGMEYLASRKVLHGDLAARNILLSENNVVKICDFGLAKSIYKNDNYKKQGDGPLPVKWMAIESIRDRVFSIQSDVWSFGIVLWEFFSLARTPYPGMEANERLYNKLVDGYRMDPPQYATKEIYTIMSDCWHPKPLSRPSFTKIADVIGNMLEDSVRQHYVDLNDPYLVMNTQRIEDGHSDYLAMLSPPDFEHLSSPHHYINDEIHGDSSPTNFTDTPGYLCMKPNQIFSPREANENVFNFDVRNKHSSEAALGAELLPMLHTQASESDCETQSPTIPSYSNPSYHIPPNVNVEKTEEDIVKSSDNYVNMPQNKSAIKGEKNNNKNQSTNNDKNNYVNNNTRDWESIKV